MTINIYWTCSEEEGLRAKEPELVLNNFYKSKIYDKRTGINNCPSISDYYKNVFSLKSIYEYNFSIDKETGAVSSKLYDQKFFDRHVIVRSQESNFFSFRTNFIFFTEEKSLKLSLEQPSLDYSKNLSNIAIVPGVIDIGKWYRVIDFSFFLKDGCTFNIKERDPFYQLRFHTDKKIKFIRYFENENLIEYKNLVLNSKNNHIGSRRLPYYYDMFSLKKRILKNIKENLE